MTCISSILNLTGDQIHTLTPSHLLTDTFDCFPFISFKNQILGIIR